MTGYTVDASVPVKWLVNGAHSGEAAALPDSGPTLVAPALIFAEVAAGLRVMRPAKRS